MKTRLLITAALAASPAASPAFEQDRFNLRVSGFHAESDLAVDARGTLRLGEDSEDAAGRAHLVDRSRRAHIQVEFGLAPRHRILGGYYDVRERNGFFQQWRPTVNALPGNDPEVSMSADYGVDFRLANLMYEFALVDTERWLVGVGAGIHWAKLGADADVLLEAAYAGETLATEGQFEWTRSRWAPSLGARIAYAPSDRWRLGLEAQGFSTGWGNFTSERGHYERAGLRAEYRVTERIGLHAGYDWFRIVLRDDFSAREEVLDARLDGTWRANLRVHGPTVGLTFGF